MRLILAASIGALVLDWSYTRIELFKTREDNAWLHQLLARHENVRRGQDEALQSCRIMVDTYVTTAGQATITAMSTDIGSVRKWRELRGYERSFPRIARAVGLQPFETPHGILQEEPERDRRLLHEQQETRFAADRPGRSN